jgi:hypothetical protein
MYEGFGFPVAHSLKRNKCLILCDNELNRELINHFREFESYFYLFNSFDQIRDIIENTDFSADKEYFKYNDTWDKAALELEAFFDDIFKAEINVETLYERRNLLRVAEAIKLRAETEIEMLNNRILELCEHIPGLTDAYNVYYNLYKDLLSEKRLFWLLSFAVKTYARNRLPRLVKFLNRIIGR